MDSEGKNVRDLKVEGFAPCWSRDGKKLAFASNRDGRIAEIYVVNSDGSGLVRLTHEKGGNDAGRPTWSPDDKQIAFFRWVGKVPEIFIVSADGGEQRKITSGGGIDPSWSPDGKKLAFASARHGSIQIYSANADGSGVTQLTATKPGATEPAWSPDGNKILFSVPGGLDAPATVGILNLPSGKVGRFAYSDKFSFFSPAWSPDGDTVLLEMSGVGIVHVLSSDPYLSPEDRSPIWKHQILALGIDGTTRQLTKADDGGGSPAASRPN